MIARQPRTPHRSPHLPSTTLFRSLQTHRVALGGRRHLAGRGLNPAQVAGLAGPHTPRLGRGVHREKHLVGGGDGGVHLGGEVEIAPMLYQSLL